MGMIEKEKVIDALKDLISGIEEHGIRSAEISTKGETIKVPSSGEWQERRSGPRFQVTIDLEWGDIQPANVGEGEESEW